MTDTPYVWVVEVPPLPDLPTVKRYTFLRQFRKKTKSGVATGVVVIGLGVRSCLLPNDRRSFWFSETAARVEMVRQMDLLRVLMERLIEQLNVVIEESEQGYQFVSDIPEGASPAPVRKTKKKGKP